MGKRANRKGKTAKKAESHVMDSKAAEGNIKDLGTREVDLKEVTIHPTFDFRDQEKDDRTELTVSMKEHGCIHKPTIRLWPGGKTKYQLVAGSRRFRSAKDLKWAKMVFNVKEMGEKDAVKITFTENAARKDITPMEEARAFKLAIKEIGLKAAEVAKSVGKSEPYVSNRMRLLKLEPEVQKLLAERKIKPGHAEHALCLLTEMPDKQKELAKDIVEMNYDISDAKDSAKMFIREKKEQEELKKEMEKAKHKKCPKCGDEAAEKSYIGKNVVRCRKCFNTWDFMTGKDPYEKGKEKKTKKTQKLEFPRTLYFKKDIVKLKSEVKQMMIKALRDEDPKKGMSVFVGGKAITISDSGVVFQEFGEKGIGGYLRFKQLENKGAENGCIRAFIDTHRDPTKRHHEMVNKILGHPQKVDNKGKVLKSKGGKK